jgi:hypothetical protein
VDVVKFNSVSSVIDMRVYGHRVGVFREQGIYDDTRVAFEFGGAFPFMCDDDRVTSSGRVLYERYPGFTSHVFEGGVDGMNHRWSLGSFPFGMF